MPVRINLSGRRFGRLVALEPVRVKKDWHYRCACDCGRETVVGAGHLGSGHTTSCGCWRAEFIKQFCRKPLMLPIGGRYGRLTIVGDRQVDARSRASYWCRCDCGKECRVAGTNLNCGHTTSCGCVQLEAVRQAVGESSKNRVLNAYVANARLRKLPFELTREQFLHLVVQPCVYCGDALGNVHVSRHGTGDFRYTGLDRVDSSLGYTLSNAAPCCRVCNVAKSNLPVGDFLAWADRLSIRQQSLKKVLTPDPSQLTLVYG